MGMAAHAEALEFGEHTDSLAGLAQPHRAYSARHRQGIAVPRYLQSELAVGLGNLVHDRLHPLMLRPAYLACQSAEDFLEHHAAAYFLIDHAGVRTGLGIFDELLGRHGDAGAGVAATGAAF